MNIERSDISGRDAEDLQAYDVIRSADVVAIYVVEHDAQLAESHLTLLSAKGFAAQVFGTAEAFLEAYDPDQEAILLLSLNLPGMNGLALLEHLTDNRLSLPTVVQGGSQDVEAAVQAMRAGAVDVLEPNAGEARFLAAIAVASEMLFSRQSVPVPKSVVAGRLALLTEREREVLTHLLLGKLNKEIASELGVSQRTIEGHRSRIREKMQARGVADLIRMVG